MKKFTFSFLTLFFVSLAVLANSTADTIIGEWISQEKDGKIIIYKQGDQYHGKISWGKTPGRKDGKNPDEKLRGRELLGAVILKNFKFTGSAWENGTIYDPNSGKTYDCILKIKDGNKTLDIRGFVGISMFGRTSTWSRS
ncbi:DUF2147 domain-containing protein [Aquirufa sp. KTFRIE-69F]|uniref:DUF2147 domain-containing protein n=1 Tax=Aquirufa originis TaxID=3096514 RepID=A0ABW6DC95_9BACT